MKKKKSAEEIAEDNQRTNSMGLFNSAEGYWLSARALEKANIKHGFRENPIRTLYFHAIELYLKALLRQAYTVDDLAKRFGHNVKRMTTEAKKYGLVIAEQDRREVFDVMTETDVVIQSRYLRTGVLEVPPDGALDRVCKNLHASVGNILRNASLPVRL
jgi:hypothetical protein